MAKKLKDIQRICIPQDELIKPYDEGEEANKGQTKGEENVEEATTAQDLEGLEFNDEQDRLVIDEGANTNNTFSENKLREIMQEKRTISHSDVESENTTSEEEDIESKF